MPEPVSNNAVCGWQEDSPSSNFYVYSFGGIDSTQQSSGIHLKSWKYDLNNDTWTDLPSLPDTLGKLASGASEIDGIIYIIGGYHVFTNGSELSSHKVHRFDCQGDTFLSDGADIPIAIDDHVQAVWNDSLIYVVTGWSNFRNVKNVQVYNPKKNAWMVATDVPNTNDYKSFGAGGFIDGNTIYYYGGAQFDTNFPIQSVLRIGKINEENPLEIEWSDTTYSNEHALYRSVAIMLDNPTWIGGSRITYNYDPIAYNGSGVVVPAAAIQQLENDEMTVSNCDDVIMDYRGLAHKMNTGEVFLAGGIGRFGVTSDQLLKLYYMPQSIDENGVQNKVSVFPNPSHGLVRIYSEKQIRNIEVYDLAGSRISSTISNGSKEVELRIDYSNQGMYILRLEFENQTTIHRKIILE